MHILFATAENGAFEGGKVGGIGDVTRHLPPALAKHDCRVTVVAPSHGFLHLRGGAEKIDRLSFIFRGYPHTADIFSLAPQQPHPGVDHLIVHHPALESFDSHGGGHRIYTDDPPDRPFYTDASRFAFFGAAIAAAASGGLFGSIDCIHLHDWHAAFVAILRAFHPDYSNLKKTRIVFTIHNLALQGIRPLRGSDSSLEAWFPGMTYNWSDVADPRWPDCVNLMASGIRLSDIVHTVSPAYAREIQNPSRKPQFHGGEGLESDLIRVNREGRLFGILNGCDYPAEKPHGKRSFPGLLNIFRSKVLRWTGPWEMVPTSQFVAYARSLELERRFRDTPLLLTAVSRIVDQKVLLLRESDSNGTSGLEGLLDAIGRDGCFILLGNGDREYEQFFVEISARRDTFLFVNGYSDEGADALYTSGDLFIMPSSYEPCGLSQLLAMRSGQPCIVHNIGGLKDTVDDGVNGFAFSGDAIHQQVDHFVQTVRTALSIKRENPSAWREICRSAAATRFRWTDTAEQYIRHLYR